MLIIQIEYILFMLKLMMYLIVISLIAILTSLFISSKAFIYTVLAVFVTINIGYFLSFIDMIIYGRKKYKKELQYIPLIHGMEYGKFLVWFIITSAWGTDVFAYLVGKSIGKHKFSKISPNKTIEGCIGGVVGSVIFGLLFALGFNYFFYMNFSYPIIVGVAIVLSVVGQLGDFAASSIKRYVGIKDFSNLIPGHGGMLDRIDSILFIAPIAYVLLLKI